MWVPVLAAALSLVNTHTWIWGGPALNGARVTWASAFPTAVYSSGPVRRLWRAGRVSVPPSVPEDPQFTYRVDQRITRLVGAAQTTAFIRTVELHRSPKCDCPGGPIRGFPIRGELWARNGVRPFRRIAGGVGHPIVVDVDVDGSSTVYAEEGGLNRVVWLGHAVLTSSRQLTYPRVAVNGAFAGWLEHTGEYVGGYAIRRLVVYDLRANRIAYQLGPARITDFDLSRDGTVAFGEDPTPVGGPDGGIAWASVADPAPHYLPGDAIPFGLRLAAGRVAFFTRAPSGNALKLESLDGKRKTTFDAAYGGFDFAGHRIAYLHSPKVIAVSRLR